MTQLAEAPVSVTLDGPAPATGGRGRRERAPETAPAAPRRRRRAAVRRPWWVASLFVLSALLVGFAVYVVLVSQLQQARDQTLLWAAYRSELAEAVAPVGQVDDQGRVLVPGAPVALIEIPAIGVSQVVVEGTTSDQLKAGPGHRRDSVLPGQAGTALVYGRQAAFGGPFGRLGELVVGDEITTTTGQGTSTYRVTGLRVAGDPQPQPLTAGQGRLTLVTADGTPFIPEDTLRVDAQLVSEAQPAPTKVITVADLSPAEQPMAGDPSGIFGLVLWVQLLLVVGLAAAWAAIRWGRWQAWIIGVPVLLAVGLGVANAASSFLPNLL
jgi:LPXTG-site transpeptidase (sortase) family protein